MVGQEIRHGDSQRAKEPRILTENQPLHGDDIALGAPGRSQHMLAGRCGRKAPGQALEEAHAERFLKSR